MPTAGHGEGKNLRAEDIERNTSKILQLKEGKKINNQLKEWTRKLKEPWRGVSGDVGDVEELRKERRKMAEQVASKG